LIFIYLALILHDIMTIKITSYSCRDYLGFVDRAPVTYWISLFLLLLLMGMIISMNIGEPWLHMATLISLLYMFHVYVLPSLLESGPSNFYDFMIHIGKVRYILYFNHAYRGSGIYDFIRQPGFLIAMACYLRVTSIPSILLGKLFPLLLTFIIFISLFALFKKFTGKSMYAAFGVLIYNSFQWIYKMHVAGQLAMLVPYYALLLLIIFHRDVRALLASTIIMIGIIISHQGIAFATLADISGLLGVTLTMYFRAGWFEETEKRHTYMRLLVLFLILWVFYLIFHNYSDFCKIATSLPYMLSARLKSIRETAEIGMSHIAENPMRRYIHMLQLASIFYVNLTGFLAVLSLRRNLKRYYSILLALLLAGWFYVFFFYGLGVLRAMFYYLVPISIAMSHFIMSKGKKLLTLVLLLGMLLFSWLNPILLCSNEAIEYTSCQDMRASFFAVTFSKNARLVGINVVFFLPEIIAHRCGLRNMLDFSHGICILTSVEKNYFVIYYDHDPVEFSTMLKKGFVVYNSGSDYILVKYPLLREGDEGIHI